MKLLEMFVNLDIYHEDIQVLIGSAKDINKEIKKQYDIADVMEDNEGLTMVLTNSHKEVLPQIMMLIKDDGKDGYMFYDTLCHEIVHGISRLFVSRAIKDDLENDEPRAYPSGYVMGMVVKEYKRWIKQPSSNKTTK